MPQWRETLVQTGWLPAVTVTGVSQSKLTFPAVQHWRVQSPTCSCISCHCTKETSHRPHPNAVLHLLSLTVLSYSCSVSCDPFPLQCFLLWNEALLSHTALLACSLFHCLFFFFLVPSLALAGSLSERLSCWSTVHREPQAITGKTKTKTLWQI